MRRRYNRFEENEAGRDNAALSFTPDRMNRAMRRFYNKKFRGRIHGDGALTWEEGTGDVMLQALEHCTNIDGIIAVHFTPNGADGMPFWRVVAYFGSDDLSVFDYVLAMNGKWVLAEESSDIYDEMGNYVSGM